LNATVCFTEIIKTKKIDTDEEKQLENADNEKFLSSLITLKNVSELIKNRQYNKALNSLKKSNYDEKWIEKLKNSILMKIQFSLRDYRGLLRTAEDNENLLPVDIRVLIALLKLKERERSRGILKRIIAAKGPSYVISRISNRELRSLYNIAGRKYYDSIMKRLAISGSITQFRRMSRYSISANLKNYLMAEINYRRKNYSTARKYLSRLPDNSYFNGKNKLLLKMDVREGRMDKIDMYLELIKNDKNIFKITLLDIATILKINGEFDLSEKYYSAFTSSISENKYSKGYWRALWRMGWLKMKSGEKSGAVELFTTGSYSPIDSYRIANLFWKEKLNGFKTGLIAEFPFTYYYSRFPGRKTMLRNRELKNFKSLLNRPAGNEILKIVSKIKKILRRGLGVYALNYINWTKKNLKLDVADLNTLKIIESLIYLRKKNFYMAFSTFIKNFPQYKMIILPRFLKSIYSPRKYFKTIKKYAKKNGVDKNIVLALIKRESFFNEGAVSSARAMGLMQLISKTAKRIAKKLKIRFRKRYLFNPEFNIRLGTFHIRELLDKYSGKMYLALAAYNAGTHRVDKWINDYRGFPEEEFIEMIPFTETRNYVKNVMRNYFFYKYYYN